MTAAWLRDLEEKVHEASERLSDARSTNEELRKQNEALQARVSELEAEIAEGSAADQSAWEEERADIRSRVEKLADHLGQLLEE
ncbi:MAG: cell division protein ZapB [Acidobacteriota bacterium]